MTFTKRFWGTIEGMFHGGLIALVSCLTRLTWSPGLIYLFTFFGGLEGFIGGDNVIESMWSRMDFYRDANIAHEGRVLNNIAGRERIRREQMERAYRPY